MRKLSLIGILILGVIFQGNGQSLQQLGLEEAYEMMAARYPLLNNKHLVANQSEINQDLIEINKLPSLNWKSEGRIQSESVQLETDGEVMVPFEIDLPLYSIRTYVEGQYLISDGGLAESKSAIEAARLETEVQEIKVQEYNLRNQINQLFLGIMMLRTQQESILISIQDLGEKKEIATAGVEQGIILPSEVDKIEIGILKLQSRSETLLRRSEGLLKKLEFLIGKKLDSTVELILPEFAISPVPVTRPELELFKLQKQGLIAQSSLIDVEKKPILSAFAQAGIGYPNPLNLLDNGIAPYGILGLQLNWKILDWEKSKKRKDVLNLKAQLIDNQEETFKFNLNAKHADFNTQILTIDEQVKAGKEILKLEEKILEQYKSQYDEGVIGSAVYIDQVNQVLKAKQELAIYEIELLNVKLNYHNDFGTY